MHLVISTPLLSAALTPLRRKKRMVKRASVSMDSTGHCMIEAGPFVARIWASGEWDGFVIFDGMVLLALSRVPPVGRQIEIAFNNEKLRIGTMTVPAHLQREPLAVKRIRLPSPCTDNRKAPAPPLQRCTETMALF